MGDNIKHPDPVTLAYIQKLRLDGLSAGEIAQKIPGKTRNAVIGLIHRHLKGGATAAKLTRVPKTDRAPRAIEPVVFSEPAAPRRFSWQDSPSG